MADDVYSQTISKVIAPELRWVGANQGNSYERSKAYSLKQEFGFSSEDIASCT